jgi:hypothetical protein
MKKTEENGLKNSIEEPLAILQPSPSKMSAWQQLPRQIRIEKKQAVWIFVGVFILIAVNITVLNRQKQNKVYLALSQQYIDPLTTWYYE